MSGQLKVGYQTTAFENYSCYQVALYTLVSLQEQITCLQIQNFIILYYWYLLGRKSIWKKNLWESKISSHQFKIESPHR